MRNISKIHYLESQLQEGERYIIPDMYPDYAITNYGRVFSMKVKAGKMGGFLKGSIQHRAKHGEYIIFGLYDKYGKLKNWFAHRLIYYFFGNKALNRGNVIHHIDFNPQNNRIENLMWFENQKAHMDYHDAVGRPLGRKGQNLKRAAQAAAKAAAAQASAEGTGESAA